MILEAGKIAWTLLFGTIWERGWTLCVEGAFGIETLLKILVSNVVQYRRLGLEGAKPAI
jgi:hypothetical protein